MIVVAGDLLRRLDIESSEGPGYGAASSARIGAVLDGQAIRTAAWLSHAQRSVRLFAKVGAADLSALESELTAREIEPSLAVAAAMPTASLAAVTESTHTTQRYLDLGAAASLDAEDASEGVLAGARWLHLSGHLFYRENSRAAASALIALAKEMGIGISVDPGSAHLLRAASASAFIDWTSGVDLVLANLDETRVLVGATGPFIDFEALGAVYPHAVVKLASMGAAYVSASRREQVAASRVEVKDRMGVGDAFVAGFLASWVEARDPLAALNQGNATAQKCLHLTGALP